LKKAPRRCGVRIAPDPDIEMGAFWDAGETTTTNMVFLGIVKKEGIEKNC